MVTKTCFDYGQTNISEGCTTNLCKVKRVRYFRYHTESRGKSTPTNTGKNNSTVVPKTENMLLPKVQPVLINQALFNFNKATYFKLFNAQIAQYFSSRFPFSPLRRKRYVPFPTMEVNVPEKNASGNWIVVSRYTKLPAGQYQTRLGDNLTGKEAFQKWYSAYAAGVQDPAARWKIVFEHLSANWSNYADLGSDNAKLYALQFIQVINDAYSGLIKIPSNF